MGPLLTFDKSFLEMISPREMDELDLNFTVFVTPTLISEIIADLRHPAPRDGKLPEEIVMALARKMAGGRGVQQMHFRPLGIANLNQHDVPMVRAGDCGQQRSKRSHHCRQEGFGLRLLA
jgi:hypothetical protein